MQKQKVQQSLAVFMVVVIDVLDRVVVKKVIHVFLKLLILRRSLVWLKMDKEKSCGLPFVLYSLDYDASSAKFGILQFLDLYYRPKIERA